MPPLSSVISNLACEMYDIVSPNFTLVGRCCHSCRANKKLSYHIGTTITLYVSKFMLCFTAMAGLVEI